MSWMRATRGSRASGNPIHNGGPFPSLYVQGGARQAIERDPQPGQPQFRVLPDDLDDLTDPDERDDILNADFIDVDDWIPNPLTPDQAAQMRTTLEGLRDEFKGQRRGYWWEDMMARFDQIAKHAVGADQAARVEEIL